ncbi:MAG: hypothetical protein JNM17_13255 [Archangium sp.]|nr:hypothetical protein [Archangium sp.]
MSLILRYAARMTPAPPSTPSAATGPVLPVVGVVLSVIGLCIPPVLVFALIIGVYSLLRARKDEDWAKRKQLAQMTIAVSGAAVLVFIGVTLPNVKRFQLRSKQTECRGVLDRALAAEKKFYETNKRYTTKLKELDPAATRTTQLLRLSKDGALWSDGTLSDDAVGSAPTITVHETNVPQLVANDIGLHGECPACSITLLCVNELDGDTTPDAWTISTIERLGNEGAKIPGGIPWNEVDDVMK